MKKYWLGIVVCLMVGLAGCRKAGPDLRIEGRSENAIEAGSSGASQTVGNGPKVVTGVPATTEDKKETDAVQTADDKTGAVAVKMQY